MDTVGNNIYDFLPARVINHSIHKRFNYFTLDKGSTDGLRKDMGVIDERGLVGMITNVSQEYAVGISMLNTKTRISVKHRKSWAIGLLRWTGLDPLKHIIEDITKTARVQVGDTIVTSGYSTFFPEGLNVAVVTRASLLEGSNFYDIEVSLTNDILSLENVYVISHYHKSEIDSLEMTAR